MTTTSDLRNSGAMCMLLLPQLLEIWLPDHNAAHHESCLAPFSKQVPELRIPPLISFLEGLPDVVTPDESFPGKRLPCGHVVSIRAILACCNLWGDAIWTPGPHCYGCTEPECEDTLEFPKIPDPRVLDGLQARLDLIEWSWTNTKPTKPERKVVGLLRDTLSRIGHRNREPELDADAGVLQPQLNTRSLKQTLVQEIEACGTIIANGIKTTETPVRGTQPYCSYRASNTPEADPSQLRYRMLSPGQECECVTPHEYIREARRWALTPAEADLDHNEEEPTDGNDEESKSQRKKTKEKPTKTVRFFAPVLVTSVRYFDPWWCDEYRDSDRYWSTGPTRLSTDRSTAADDEWEIDMLENPGALAATMLRVLKEGVEAGESDDDGSDEMWDEDILADMERRAKELLADEDSD